MTGETIVYKGIKKLIIRLFNSEMQKQFASEKLFETEVYSIYLKVINEFKKRYPKKEVSDKFYFYESKLFEEEILKLRFFKGYNLKNTIERLNLEVSIIIPSEEELNNFQNIFDQYIENNEKLRLLERDLTFKDEIFNLSKITLENNDLLKSLSQEVHPKLERQWRREVNSYFERLKAFNPKIALSLLNDFTNSLNGEEDKPTNNLLAQIYYQKGICLQFLQQKSEANKSFIQAYELNRNEKAYRDQAIFAYFVEGDVLIAKKMVESVLQEDSLNNIAWAIKLFLSEERELSQILEEIPSLVKREIIFNQIVFNYYFLTNTKVLYLLESSLLPNLEQLESLTYNITIETLNQSIFVINRLFTLTIRGYNCISFGELEGLNTQGLKLLNTKLEQITSTLENTELKKQYLIFYSLYSFSKYCITRNKRDAIEMKEQLEISDTIQAIYFLICANILQIEEEYDEAIELLLSAEAYVKNDRDKFAYYLQLGTVYSRKKDYNKRIEQFQKSIIAISKVDDEMLSAYINLLLILKLDNKLSADVILSNSHKTFASSQSSQLINCFIDCLSNESEEQYSILLEDLVSKEDTQVILKLYIADLYHIIAAHKKAIDVYKKYLDTEKQTPELYLYIQSLYEQKSDSKTLIKLLEKWRTNFVYNETLLKVEYNLRMSMLDWDEALNICVYALKHDPDSETFLGAIIKVLDKQNAHKESYKEYIDRYLSLDLKAFESIPTIADVIQRNISIDIAVDLVYKYYDRHPSLQMNLFRLSLLYKEQSEEQSKFKDFEVVEIGCYVEYEVNGNIDVIEVKEHLEYNGTNLTDSILGKKKNDVIKLKALYSNAEYNFQILFIMDKYGCKLRHMLKAFNNPILAPFDSIDTKGLGVEELNAQLQKQFGKQGDERAMATENALSRYYDYDPSYTLFVLVQGLFSFSYIKAFKHLTSSSGIILNPCYSYQTQIKSDSLFLIDLSTLSILYEISSTYKLPSFPNLCISKYLIEILQNELNDIKRQPPSRMSLIIKTDGVFPILEDEDKHSETIDYYEDLISWTEENCIAIVEDMTVDAIMTKKEKDYSKGFDFTFNYFANTLFIRQEKNAILVTDDNAYLSLMGVDLQHMSMSSELFIKSFVGDSHECLDLFIDKRYRGFSYTFGQLTNLFTNYRNKDFKCNKYLFVIETSRMNNLPSLVPLLVYIWFDGNLTLHMKEIEIKRILKQLLFQCKEKSYLREVLDNALKYCFYLLDEKSVRTFKQWIIEIEELSS